MQMWKINLIEYFIKYESYQAMLAQNNMLLCLIDIKKKSHVNKNIFESERIWIIN